MIGPVPERDSRRHSAGLQARGAAGSPELSGNDWLTYWHPLERAE